MSAGSGYAAGATGGSASVALTVAQMPSHQHNLAYWPSSAAAGSNAWIVNVGYESPVYTSSSSVRPTGGGAAHENRPPYYAVYMWRRTA